MPGSPGEQNHRPGCPWSLAEGHSLGGVEGLWGVRLTAGASERAGRPRNDGESLELGTWCYNPTRHRCNRLTSTSHEVLAETPGVRGRVEG